MLTFWTLELIDAGQDRPQSWSEDWSFYSGIHWLVFARFSLFILAAS
jgi:hypothetical protein